MKMIQTCQQVLFDLKSAIEQIDAATYSTPIPLLYKASIGGHCRHIIEFFQCLRAQLQEGEVCYDLRARDFEIENDPKAAIAALDELQSWLRSPIENTALSLQVNHGTEAEENVEISSNLLRELAFNVEHAIHHMAIIKIGLSAQFPAIQLPGHFGVAPSTIRYQNQLNH